FNDVPAQLGRRAPRPRADLGRRRRAVPPTPAGIRPPADRSGHPRLYPPLGEPGDEHPGGRPGTPPARGRVRIAEAPARAACTDVSDLEPAAPRTHQGASPARGAHVVQHVETTDPDGPASARRAK